MNPDMPLDEIVKATRQPQKRRGAPGRGRTRSSPTASGGLRAGKAGRAPGAAAARRAPRAFPGHKHIAGASLDDIAAADEDERTLKVSKETNVKKCAGSIKYIIGVAGSPPTALAGGASAINQAVKAIAIARADLTADEDEPMDILVQPTFDGGSVRCALEMSRVKPIADEMDTEDFLVKGTSDPYKVAGAIAGRLRDGERIGVLSKGDEAVFKTVQSLAVARRYLEEDEIDVKFAPRFVDLEDDGGIASTYVHFAVLGRGPRR
mmetsp:Transcript_10832/g.27885  ORF Transcript_10832/g.27885 Transcript_10832/m.27885 type:complete len:264 (-) Transcript_10832:178-969(-)